MNLTNALGWTLIHFLWQGALIAALLVGTLAVLRYAGSRARYAAGCAAMMLMLVCAGVTFLELKFTGRPSHRSAPALGNLLVNPWPLTDKRGIDGALAAVAVADYVPALVWAWFGGVIYLSIRSLGSWIVAERFAQRRTWPAEAIWHERFAALAKRLSISKPVRLAVSALAEVPAVIGSVRPIVLVPASIFMGLTAEQIEALLAHELAHVRRHDYLVNLLQTAVEMLLFYHPAVWWVSRNIRNERENCCDDLAVEVCGNTLTYVQALTELEQMRRGTPRLAMAADGGSLLGRVQRLLGVKQARSAASLGWVAGIAIVAGVLVATSLAQQNGVPTPVPAQARLSAVAQQNREIAQRTGAVARQSGEAAHGWLDEIQGEGYRNLNVDKLIEMKIQGVTGEYIRQIRAAGFELTADQLVEFRIQGVTAAFINELKQVGLQDLNADKIIELKIQGADPVWIRQIQSLGYSNVSAENFIELRIQGVTPDFIREARNRFKDLTIDQLIQLKQFGILN